MNAVHGVSLSYALLLVVLCPSAKLGKGHVYQLVAVVQCVKTVRELSVPNLLSVLFQKFYRLLKGAAALSVSLVHVVE